ncbi:MAG: DUF1570 domain-containing protein [Archangium sp.]
MMRGVAAAAVAAIVFSSCAHFECQKHGGTEVRSIATDHFVIISSLPLDKHRAQAEKLELLWDSFGAFFGVTVERARIPVVLMNSASDVSSFGSGALGFVQRRGPTALVVGAPDGDGVGTSAHELTHLVSAFMVPRQPRWVSEGLAALFEDAKFRDVRSVEMGRWNEPRARGARFQLMSLDELQRWNERTLDDGAAYASSWAWIHYLANHDEARLRRLFDALRGTAPIADVMRQVFPPGERKRLYDVVSAYLSNARFHGWETSLTRTPTIEQPVVLSDWQVHLLRSRLSPERAMEEEDIAISLAPTADAARDRGDQGAARGTEAGVAPR